MEHMRIIVCDNGSHQMKVGFADNERPASVFPTVVGRPHQPNMTVTQAYVGHEALRRGNLRLIYPIQQGRIVDYEAMETIWRHMFNNVLCVNPADYIVLLTEPSNTDPDRRSKIAQIMFDTFSVGAICFANQAVLSLLASGLPTGVVWEMGHGVADSVPIYQNSVVKNCVIPGPVTGCELTEYLQSLLQEDGYWVDRWNDLQEMKERHVYVAQNFVHEEELAKRSNVGTTLFTLSNGQQVPITQLQKIKCAEALFQPHLIGRGHRGGGVHATIFTSIELCRQRGMHQELWQNIVLSGVSTKFRGLTERLQTVLEEFIPNVNVIRLEREHPVWMGGSLSHRMLRDFREKYCITEDEFDGTNEECVQYKYIGA